MRRLIHPALALLLLAPAAARGAAGPELIKARDGS